MQSNESDPSKFRRNRAWAIIAIILPALGFVLSAWGVWAALEDGDKFKAFRRVVGASLFLFWSFEKYRSFRSFSSGV